MCRRVTSAGGFYTFVTRGLGRVLGLGSGLLIALCYIDGQGLPRHLRSGPLHTSRTDFTQGRPCVKVGRDV